MAIPEKDLLTKIDAFLDVMRHVSPTQFGLDAANDAKLVPQLREGRELRGQTRDRIVAYMIRATKERTAELKELTPKMTAMAPSARAAQP